MSLPSPFALRGRAPSGAAVMSVWTAWVSTPEDRFLSAFGREEEHARAQLESLGHAVVALRRDAEIACACGAEALFRFLEPEGPPLRTSSGPVPAPRRGRHVCCSCAPPGSVPMNVRCL